jgi:hypothetical protein
MSELESFEFFLEIKNKEIQELKDKLERTKAASDAMINAGMANRKKLIKIGDDLIKRVEEENTFDDLIQPSRELIDLIIEWNNALGRKSGYE